MIRASARVRLLCGLLMLVVAQTASAQQLLFHFPLDGSPEARGWGATESRLYLLDEGEGPTTVPGKVGDALYFRGNAAIAMPFELDMATYPKVTVTAWVKVDAGSPGERTVFSSGNGNVPRLMIYTTKAAFHAARGVDMAKTSITPDEWVFVAGTIDVEAARLQVIQGDLAQTRERIRTDNLYPASRYRNPEDGSLPSVPYVFIGSHGFNQWRANRMAIDDVRVYAGVLSAEQIEALRAGQDVVLADNASAPTFYGGGLTQENVDDLAARRAAGAAPEITYASEEEALAAQESREREAAEAELARQQNELEAARRAAGSTSGSTGSDQPSGTGRPAPVGEARFSGVAGHVGQNRRTIDLEDQFLHRIAWFESSDAPCRIAIAGEDVSSEVQLDVGCPNNIRPFKLFLSDQSRSVALPDAVIGGIAVCNNNPRALYNEALRLKGIRITGERVNDDGTTAFDPASDEDYLRNCVEWSIPNLCPVNPTHLATGLIVHSNDSGSTGNNEDIVGLQLVCRQIGLR